MTRLAALAVAVLCLTPLWAQDIDNRPFEVGAEWSDGLVKGYFYDQIFLFEIDYESSTSLTKNVRFSWPIPKDWRSSYRFMLDIVPGIWESDRDKEMGYDPIQKEEFYAGLQYLDRNIDLRLLYPIALPNSHPTGFLSLPKWRIAKLTSSTDFIARGFLDVSNLDDFDFQVGICQRFGSIEAKIYSDLEWSIGFRTSTSTLLY